MLKKVCHLLRHILNLPAIGSRRNPRPRGFVPAVEDLQARVVPATLINGNLYIFGTNGPDVVSVTYQSLTIKVIENGQTQSFPIASITGRQIWFMGYGGNDSYDARNS